MTPSLWDQAAKQAAREMPNAPLEELEERARQIEAQLLKEKPIDPHPRSPQVQHPAGQMVPDYREIGRRLMINSGVDPEAPLNIDWNHVEDIRDNRDPETVGLELFLHRQSMPSDPLSSIASMNGTKPNAV